MKDRRRLWGINGSGRFRKTFKLEEGNTMRHALLFTLVIAFMSAGSTLAQAAVTGDAAGVSEAGMTMRAADPFAITIDGQKDDWYKQLTGPDNGYIHIPGSMHNDNGAPDNDEDLSAYLWVAWDADYLYIYEEVKDNVVHLNNPTRYQNDCLEMYFDPDPSLKKVTGPTGFGLSALDSVDVEDPANLSGVAEMKAFASFTATEADYSRRITDDGYVLECRVDWDWIQWPGWGPPVPALGNIFGMAVMNHDNDVSQREGSIEWAAALKDAVWNDAQLHGTVTFEADHRLKLEAKNSIVPANVNADAAAYVPEADTGIEEITASNAAPAMFALGQNYPNPFNPATRLTYDLPKQTKVKIVVYDMLGREVETLLDEVKQAGRYTIQFDASKLTSGVYFCSLFHDNQRITRKMMLLK
jgi:hypothetical protein